MTEPQVSTAADGAAAHAPLDPAVVDSLRRLGSRTGRDVLAELTDLFLTTADGQIATAQQLVREAELPELARVAHALKGSASVIGGRRVAAAAADLETTCLTGVGSAAGDEAARTALDRCIAELEQLRSAVQELTRPA